VLYDTLFFLDIKTLEFGTTTSGTNYQLMGCHIPEEWRSYVCSCWLTVFCNKKNMYWY